MLKRAAFLLLLVPVQAMNMAMAGHFFHLLDSFDSNPTAIDYNCEQSVEAAPYQSVRIERDGSVMVTSSDGNGTRESVRVSGDPNIQITDDNDEQSTDEAPDTDEDTETNSGQ